MQDLTVAVIQHSLSHLSEILIVRMQRQYNTDWVVLTYIRKVTKALSDTINIVFVNRIFLHNYLNKNPQFPTTNNIHKLSCLERKLCN